MDNQKSFGFLKRNFFPIHNHELRKFLPMSVLFFFISGNYAILRGLKDVFLISAGGPEAIAAAKLWGVLPAVVLFKIAFDEISQRTGRTGRFNIIVGYFLVYFSLFIFLFYPNRGWLELHGLADRMHQLLPAFDNIWTVIRFWPTTIFYIHAEAWGVFGISVLFFSFANEITNVRQSGRFYPFVSIAANLGTLLAGEFMRGTIISNPSMQTLLLPVLVNFVVLMVVYTLFSRAISENPAKYEIEVKPKKKKPKLSFLQSIKLLATSRYLLLIAFIVVVYATCINLFEAIYRDFLKDMALKAAPAIKDALAAKGEVITLKDASMVFLRKYGGLQLSLVGIFAIIFSLFFAAPAMRLGWRFMGSVTPSMLLLNTSLFLLLLFFGDHFAFMAGWFGLDVPSFTLMVGLLNVVCIKSSKYTFFDPFKENAYIPLDREQKLLGKSSIENMSRLGKAGGSVLIGMVVAPLGGIKVWRLPLGFIILVIVAVWLLAVQSLTSRFHKLVKLKKLNQEPIAKKASTKDATVNASTTPVKDKKVKGK